MYGALLTVPCEPAADFGLIFMNTQQYTTMCGHAVIGAATAVVETGMLPAGRADALEADPEVVFDTPVGLVRTQIRVRGGQVSRVSFLSTPAFVYQVGACLLLPDHGQLSVDLVYSGGFFALVEAQRVGLALVPQNADALADLGAQLRQAANDQLAVEHPEMSFLTTIDAVEFHDPAVQQAGGSLVARNATTFGERTLDRSPCGTGTCARMAALHARGELQLDQTFVSESIIGTRFEGRIVEETQVGERRAIIPQVTGRAHLTGFHQFVLDPDDPFPGGFSLGNQGPGGGTQE